MKRKTISKNLKYKGIGLHKGEDIILRLKPAPVNTGIVFYRKDLKDGENKIVLDIDNVFDLTRGTNLINEYKASVYTIEHFLSSLYVFGITDIIVEIDGNELPIIDGSSKKFIELIKENIKEYKEEVEELIIKKPIYVTHGDKHVVGLPYDGYKITYSVNYNHSYLKSQLLEIEVNVDNYVNEISGARTFCFDYEIEYLKANNLALGGSLDNAIVIKKDGILNPGGLRYQDEFVRHKILDLIGDLKVLNRPIKGHIIAVKAGHAINIDFARELVKNFL
ncbi:UDP-3-O-[3-hydroxymyristoyl] N-acetylglucosamine deacetylase [Hypnocyclicus thermotrophus]|uniref:UDP-3-O-acyl-N-acetylglucosamine deacetylase n=1 Tax=Hypnocyclicus thermotrophus TaxID=1627895 RepID=A0AA46I619_9FUSO|nr:UDP-3-O-acyl-N-acetylglucosamine deacetylase [Hypnocyclicus thermotrophus]TDT71878.1 UDP-3-O-[3-hydroxymyristoyl] N-acetylglucosamine deacetylase [Hypnocyclicus thermotrophus]